MGNALPVLRHLSITTRTAAFARAGDTAEQLAHTVLLLPDLELGSMDNPHALMTHGRLIFDTVLLLKEFVPTQGFDMKALEKLIADYALIVYGRAEDANAGACAIYEESGGQKLLVPHARIGSKSMLNHGYGWTDPPFAGDHRRREDI